MKKLLKKPWRLLRPKEKLKNKVVKRSSLMLLVISVINCICEKKKVNVIYEECVCRGTPSIGIITNSGLNYTVKLGHYLLLFR